MEPVGLANPLLGRLAEMRPFYDLLVRTMGVSRPAGIFDLWNKDSHSAGHMRSGEWLGEGEGWYLAPSAGFFAAGLPPTYSQDGATATLMSGDGPLAWPEKDIKRLLSGGVYMDAYALACLNEMGFAEFTGFRVERFLEVDCIEQFTDHQLNRGIAGRVRDARQSFLDATRPAAVLEPTQPGAAAVSRMVNYTPVEVATCGTGVFENALGGRVCVAGYYPWTQLHFHSKLAQLKSVMRWLSGDRLPAYVSSPHKVYLWARETADGRLALAVLNAHSDDAKEMTLMIRTQQEQLTLVDMGCNETRVSRSRTEGPYSEFLLPEVPAWHMRLAIV
jgi:hypothetical protein